MTCLDEMLWEHLVFQNVILTTEMQNICSILGQLWELEERFLYSAQAEGMYCIWCCDTGLGLAYECCLRPRQIHKKKSSPWCFPHVFSHTISLSLSWTLNVSRNYLNTSLTAYFLTMQLNKIQVHQAKSK